MTLGIDGNRSVRQRLRDRRRPVGAAQQRTYPRDQLVRTERFREVIVSAELQSDDSLRLFRARRQHDDRDIGGLLVRADAPADFQPVEMRQHQVEYQEVWRLGRNRVERIAS